MFTYTLIKYLFQNKLYYQMSGRRDLNSGPHDPQSCALTGLRYAPIVWMNTVN